MYNMTFTEGTANIFELFVGVNDGSNGLFASLLLLALFVVMFIMFKNSDTKVVLIGASFLCSLIGIFFWIAGLMSFSILIIPIILFIGSIIYKVAS